MCGCAYAHVCVLGTGEGEGRNRGVTLTNLLTSIIPSTIQAFRIILLKKKIAAQLTLRKNSVTINSWATTGVTFALINPRTGVKHLSLCQLNPFTSLKLHMLGKNFST